MGPTTAEPLGGSWGGQPDPRVGRGSIFTATCPGKLPASAPSEIFLERGQLCQESVPSHFSLSFTQLTFPCLPKANAAVTCSESLPTPQQY